MIPKRGTVTLVFAYAILNNIAQQTSIFRVRYEMEQEMNGVTEDQNPTISTPYIILIVAVVAIIVAFYVFCIAETKFCLSCRKKLCFSNSEQKSSNSERKSKNGENENPENEKLNSKQDSEIV